MSVEFAYATDLFDDGDRRGASLDRFTRVLAAVVADPTVAVGDIDLLGADEQRAPLHDWSPPALRRPPPTPGAADSPAPAARDPNAVAVQAGELTLTYAELDAAVQPAGPALDRRGRRPGIARRGSASAFGGVASSPCSPC